ncbi:unnamed protein product, partial [Oppiella nova]
YWRDAQEGRQSKDDIRHIINAVYRPARHYAILHVQMDHYSLTLHDVLTQLRRYFDAKPRKLLPDLGYYIMSELLLEIMEGLDYLHTRDPPITHRKLRTDNIFIDPRSGALFVKLGKFTRPEHRDVPRGAQTMSVSVVFNKSSHKYLAPEVKQNQKYSNKSDVYCMGVIIQDMFNFDINRFGYNTTNSTDTLTGKYSELNNLTIQLLNGMTRRRPTCAEVLQNRNLWSLPITAILDQIVDTIDVNQSYDINSDFVANFLQTKYKFNESIAQTLAVNHEEREDRRLSTIDENNSGVNVNNFTILEQLSAGAFGQTYKVLDNQSDVNQQIHAFNVLTQLEPQFTRQLLSNWLEYSSIGDDIPVLMLYTQSEWCLMSLTELMPKMHGYFGVDAQHLLPPLAYYMASELLLEILECIQYLHTCAPPIIHCNIKPNNILIAPVSNGRFVKLADIKGPGVGNTGGPTGGDRYLAPEVRHSGKYSVKSDIYSTGVLVQQLFNFDTNTIENMNSEYKPMYGKLLETTIKCLNGISHVRPTSDQLLENSWEWAVPYGAIRDEICEHRDVTIQDINQQFIEHFMQTKYVMNEEILAMNTNPMNTSMIDMSIHEAIPEEPSDESLDDNIPTHEVIHTIDSVDTGTPCEESIEISRDIDITTETLNQSSDEIITEMYKSSEDLTDIAIDVVLPNALVDNEDIPTNDTALTHPKPIDITTDEGLPISMSRDVLIHSEPIVISPDVVTTTENSVDISRVEAIPYMDSEEMDTQVKVAIDREDIIDDIIANHEFFDPDQVLPKREMDITADEFIIPVLTERLHAEQSVSNYLDIEKAVTDEDRDVAIDKLIESIDSEMGIDLQNKQSIDEQIDKIIDDQNLLNSSVSLTLDQIINIAPGHVNGIPDDDLAINEPIITKEVIIIREEPMDESLDKIIIDQKLQTSESMDQQIDCILDEQDLLNREVNLTLDQISGDTDIAPRNLYLSMDNNNEDIVEIPIENNKYSDNFIEVGQLAIGDFGPVYKVLHKAYQTPSTIKRIKIIDSNDYKIYKHVLSVWSQLDPEHVLKYLCHWCEYDDYSRNPFMFWLYIQTDVYIMSLTEVIPKLNDYFDAKPRQLYQPMAYYVASELLLDVLECTHYLHTCAPPITHANIKPNNILITCGPTVRCVKLTDIGLQVPHKTMNGEQYDPYIAPELLDGTGTARPRCEFLLNAKQDWALPYRVVREAIPNIVDVNRTYDTNHEFIEYFLQTKYNFNEKPQPLIQTMHKFSDLSIDEKRLENHFLVDSIVQIAQGDWGTKKTIIFKDYMRLNCGHR